MENIIIDLFRQAGQQCDKKLVKDLARCYGVK